MLRRVSRIYFALLFIIGLASSARSQSLQELQDTVEYYSTRIENWSLTSHPFNPAYSKEDQHLSHQMRQQDKLIVAQMDTLRKQIKEAEAASHYSLASSYQSSIDSLTRISDTLSDRELALHMKYDTLSALNLNLLSYLSKILPKVPRSISYQFKTPVNIQTSPDHKLRIWDWDTYTGGSMRCNYQLAEYLTAGGIKTRVLENGDFRDVGSSDFCDTVYQVTANNGKPYYLPVMIGKYSNMDGGASIKAFAIVDDSLNTSVPLFHTPKKILSSVDHRIDERLDNADNRIHMRGRTLYIPLVREDDVITSKSLRYDFDGKQFVYKGVEKHAKPRK